MASQNRELKKAGLKVTAPRLKILAMLGDASEQGDHLSAEGDELVRVEGPDAPNWDESQSEGPASEAPEAS